MQTFAFKQFSGNKKTGPITVTRSQSSTCPPTCGQFFNCYGKGGPSQIHWGALNRGESKPSHRTWKELLKAIKTQATKVWRHNETGDLPGKGNTISAKMMAELASANKGKNGFTYTHKPVFGGKYKVIHKGGHDAKKVSAGVALKNRKEIQLANDRGFVVNLSADTLSDVDRKADLGIAPVVCVLPVDASEGIRYTTPQGRKIVTCPASIKANEGKIFCATCELCAKKDRKSVIGFPAHGFAKKRTGLNVIQ